VICDVIDSHVSGCSNGIGGGAMKPLQLYGIFFYGFKRCASKNAVLRFNQKGGKFKSVAPKRKVAKAHE